MASVHFLKFLQNVISWISRLVSYGIKQLYQQCFVRGLKRGLMSGVIEHCYEVGLRIYHTNWKCCTLDYAQE